MRVASLFLFASLLVPSLAAPLPTQDLVASQSELVSPRSASTLSGFVHDLLKRTFVVDLLPGGSKRGIPVTKGGRGLPAMNEERGIPVTKGGRGIPVTKGGRGLPVMNEERGIPVTKGGRGIPVTKGGRGLPVMNEERGIPVTKGGRGIPVTKGGR